MNLPISMRIKKLVDTLLRLFPYLLAGLPIYAVISGLCQVNHDTVPTDTPGVTDLATFDFENRVAQVAMRETGSIYVYPGVFYSSADFASGLISTERAISTPSLTKSRENTAPCAWCSNFGSIRPMPLQAKAYPMPNAFSLTV